MKYPSNCIYVDKRGNGIAVNSAVDGIIKVLKYKSGKAVIDIKVKRRETLQMYTNQILTGMKANRLKYSEYIPTNVNIISVLENLFRNGVVDTTEEYKASHKDKQTIGVYKIEIFFENLVP